MVTAYGLFISEERVKGASAETAFAVLPEAPSRELWEVQQLRVVDCVALFQTGKAQTNQAERKQKARRRFRR